MTGSPDLMEGMRGLDDTAGHYEMLWRYFAGDLPERFASERLRQVIGKTAKDYRFRLSRVPIEALVNRLGINAIVSSRGDAVNATIEEIRQANDMELQEPFITERTLALGDSYLLVWPVEDDDEDIDEDTASSGVEFAYQSPLSCRAFYDAQDGRRVRFTVRRWTEETALGTVWRAEVWYADRVEPWTTLPGMKASDSEAWLPYTEGESAWPEYHDFGEIPIKHMRTDLPYGRSEIEDFIGAQNIVTKATATQSNGIESHGWRERWRIADDKAILEQTGDTVPWPDATDATPAASVPTSGRAQGPGTEQTFHGTKAVGEYSATDLASFESPIDHWVRLGAAASGTPLTEFDPRFGANMSGVAWDRAERPMKRKEADRKRFFLRFWRETYVLALALVGVRDAGEITVNWAPPEVISDPEWWATANLRRDHGVPQRTILLEANYTEETLEAWEAEKDDDSETLDRAITRIALLGDAMQKLGAGATLLGVPSDRIATLVERLLSEAGSTGKLILEEPEPIEEEEEIEDDPSSDGASDQDR